MSFCWIIFLHFLVVFFVFSSSFSSSFTSVFFFPLPILFLFLFSFSFFLFLCLCSFLFFLFLFFLSIYFKPTSVITHHSYINISTKIVSLPNRCRVSFTTTAAAPRLSRGPSSKERCIVQSPFTLSRITHISIVSIITSRWVFPLRSVGFACGIGGSVHLQDWYDVAEMWGLLLKYVIFNY